jgi:hypothetical protein
MGALLDQFAAEGVRIEATGDGTLRAYGRLTDRLRSAIRAHKPAILAELAAANDELPEREDCGPDVMQRRRRALAILAEQPERQIAVVAEPGDPAHVTVAIRGVAVGDLEVPAERYDAFALLALMETYGHA